MCLGNFISRKTRRMYRETASDMASLLWSQNNRRESAARVPEVFCAPKTQQLACLVIIHGGCLTCSPKQPHKMNARSVWVPGYHSFPK